MILLMIINIIRSKHHLRSRIKTASFTALLHASVTSLKQGSKGFWLQFLVELDVVELGVLELVYQLACLVAALDLAVVFLGRTCLAYMCVDK